MQGQFDSLDGWVYSHALFPAAPGFYVDWGDESERRAVVAWNIGSRKKQFGEDSEIEVVSCDPVFVLHDSTFGLDRAVILQPDGSVVRFS